MTGPEDYAQMVARVYEGWGRGDFSASDGVYDPKITLVLDPQMPDAGAYEGIEAIRGYMGLFLEAWSELTISAVSIEGSGDRVLAEVRQEGVGLDSGIPVGFNYFQLWTFREGRAVRLESIMYEGPARAAFAAS